MDYPPTVDPQTVRSPVSFSFAWEQFELAVDQRQLSAEASRVPLPNGGASVTLPENGSPLITGNRGTVFFMEGEPGPIQGKVIAIMVGDKDHFRNLPPKPKVRLHSACSFSVLGEANTAFLLRRIQEEQPSSLATHLDIAHDLLFLDRAPSRDCDCRAQGRIALQKILEESGVFMDLVDQEARGLGLINKLAIYALQRQGFNT